MNEEECDRRADALIRVLEKYGLPYLDSPRFDWVFSSVSIVVDAVAGEKGDFRAIQPSAEREKFRRVGALAKKLAEDLRALDRETMYAIRIASEAVLPPPESLNDADIYRDMASQLVGEGEITNSVLERVHEDFWDGFWEKASTLDAVINQITPEVARFIDAAPNAGRRDMTSVVAVEHLRAIWEEAMNKGPAPRSITDAGEFADFLTDAFAALGLRNNCRAAMDSWNEYCLKNPDGWHR
jgi:hypothetical protein